MSLKCYLERVDFGDMLRFVGRLLEDHGANCQMEKVDGTTPKVLVCCHSCFLNQLNLVVANHFLLIYLIL